MGVKATIYNYLLRDILNERMLLQIKMTVLASP